MIRHQSGLAKNDIDISTDPKTQSVENRINLLLKICNGMDVSNNGGLKYFLTSICHHRKHETVY